MNSTDPIPVLILAGGNISAKFPFLRAQCACPALMPINTKTLVSHVISAYRNEKQSYALHLFVDREFVQDVLAELPPQRHNYELHGIESSSGVVGTLREALRIVKTEGQIVVNLATTIPAVEVEPDTVYLGNEETFNGQWSAVEIKAGHVRFLFKRDNIQQCRAHPFTGLFSMAYSSLVAATEEAAVSDDLVSVIQTANGKTALQFKISKWMDCGHENNYLNTRADLISSRSFNSLCVRQREGIVRKASEHKEKIRREAAYIEMLPERLKIYFPRVLHQLWNDNVFEAYEMEFYGYPNLAEYLLYWDLTAARWQRIFQSLGEILDAFREFPYSIGPQEFRSFLWQKTVGRIESFLEKVAPAHLGKELLTSDLIINGKKHRSLAARLPQIEKRCAELYDEDAFCVFHGDFCFNNILYDASSGIVRLIDPRGAFSERTVGIYGDRRYDLSKLYHSAVGQYDYMVNGIYECERQASENYRLSIPPRANQETVTRYMSELISAQNVKPSEIEFSTALLFLSMTPLHAEDPLRQRAFFLQGMQLLETSFG